MTATTAFDIRADLFPDGGELDEEAGHRYERDLAKQFEESPEGKALAAEGIELGFAGNIVHYLLWHEGVSVPEMTEEQFESVIFGIIPAKVMVEPEEARAMILEARAFCRYLEWAHGLAGARSCLAAIENDSAIEELEEALANPENWGMAKSVVMQGKAKGFDVSSKEGLEAWFATYNASLPPPPPHPALGGVAPNSHKAAEARRKKRKQQKAARRRNR
jgi:hypothetical protein